MAELSACECRFTGNYNKRPCNTFCVTPITPSELIIICNTYVKISLIKSQSLGILWVTSSVTYSPHCYLSLTFLAITASIFSLKHSVTITIVGKYFSIRILTKLALDFIRVLVLLSCLFISVIALFYLIEEQVISLFCELFVE